MSKPEDIVANRIIDMIEAGETPPWQRTWKKEDTPRSLNGHAYTGINLWTCLLSGYSSPVFVTMNMAKKAGGKIRKGEKSLPIVYYKKIEKKDGSDYLMSRFYKVWNIEQCEGLKLPATPDVEEIDHDPIDSAEAIVAGYEGPEVAFMGSQPCYVPVRDKVEMTPMNKFIGDNGAENYYSVLFHELAHSTGHRDRLNREGIADLVRMGDHKYSKEELIAEFTAAMLASECGFLDKTVDNSAAYIKGWVSKLKDKPVMLVRAASAAGKAKDCILGKAKEAVKAA